MLAYVNYFLKSCNIAAVYATNRTNTRVSMHATVPEFVAGPARIQRFNS
ncbi:hypothetical protein PJIAN_4528 [Paludibacter jiangxiensis]|uniref:Uncharacterized protein n=1 Tax=Paludibacter jiangxiensis TaxID=681398 RepID=A0A161LFP8_9BACT|nr:hypothetical protein PJIAN_4528 [Paludibacter jiangxiensis]